jgi:hypothetical protein
MSVSRTVTLHGIRVPLRTAMSDTDLDAAVQLVRERMEHIAGGATHREPAVTAALAALNLAGEQLASGRNEADAGAIEALCRRIEAYLTEEGADG